MTSAPAGQAPPVRPDAPECRFCGAPLTAHQAAAGGVCDARLCETRRVQEASRRIFQRDWRDYVERQRRGVEAASALVAAAVARLEEAPERIAFGVVPHQDRVTVPLPDERRAAFEAHLGQIVAAAFAGEAPEPQLARRAVEEAPEAPLIGAACATCRGRCCHLGGPSHAFLDAGTIRLYRARHPEATAAEVTAHYLAHLPERSVEHSCLYHGERGCVLPRDERADVCNRYHCNPQTDLLRRYREMGATKAVIVADEADCGPAVATFEAGTGWRPVPPEAGMESPGAPSSEAIADAVTAAIAQVPPDLPGDRPEVPLSPVCAWCGAPIDPHQAVRTHSCGRPACERKRRLELAAQVGERRRAGHRARVGRMREAASGELARAAEMLGVARESLQVGVVPHQDAPLEPLSLARRVAFEAHLDAIAAVGFAADLPEGRADGVRRESDADEPALARAACATCQGACCRFGAETMAYLTAEEVLRYRMTDPAPTPEGFRDRYLGYLPAVSVRNSCVFHGPAGCMLPRADRGTPCNSYRCIGLEVLLDQQWFGAPAAAIIASDEDEPVAIGLCDAAGFHRLPPGSA